MAQNLKLDPNSGDYVIQNGRPVEDGTLNTPAYIRLKTRRNKWMYAPDTSYGSDFHLFYRRHLAQNDSAIVTVAKRAVAPLVSSGRAASVDASLDGTARQAVELNVNIVQANGQESQLSLTPITN